jgi:2-dehydropantoate 2-reductase
VNRDRRAAWYDGEVDGRFAGSGPAIVGVGAIGGVVAACLYDRRPRLCVRRGFERLEIRLDGRTRRFEGLSLVSSPEAISTAHEIVFVATKAHQTEGAASWLSHLVGPGTIVVVLQNGVEHRERVAPWVDTQACILPAVVDLPATCAAPGQVTLKRSGTLVLPPVAEAARVVALFEGAPWIRASMEEDFAGVMWRKLCVNVVSGAIPALTDRPAGVFRDEAVAKLARGLVRECMAVARAEGVALPADLDRSIVAEFAASPPQSENAMLLDRRAGRRLEADARNGAVARFGARHGIPTPLNAMAAALLGAINA